MTVRLLSLCVLLLVTVAGAHASERAGSMVETVTIDTHGVTSVDVVSKYLTVRVGDILTQQGIDRDYANLTRVGGFTASLSILDGDRPNTVRLHWDVGDKALAPTYHPFYADRPLTAPIEGIGWVMTSPPLDRHGTNVSAFSQLARRANLFAGLVTVPMRVNAGKGTENDMVFEYSTGKGVYRQVVPPNKNVYSWSDQYAFDYWSHDANNTQLEFGLRFIKSSTQLPSGIVSPFLYPTWRAASRNLVGEIGLLHGCASAAAHWYPPYCSFQYRLEFTDGLGGLGSTSKYESFFASAARYVRTGYSTIALQGQVGRSGGVLPDSFLLCSGVRAYPKPFCGTDAQLLQIEYRIDDALPQKIKFIPFFDDAASRTRGQIVPEPTSTFEWHDSYGIGVSYRNLIRFDLGYGKPGGRLTFALEGQTF